MKLPRLFSGRLGLREAGLDLATSELASCLQFTSGGVFAWYLLGAESWDFLALPDRVRLWDQQAYRWGRLAETAPDQGRPIRIRVTTRPYPSYEFARSLDDTATPLPQVDGGESWNDYLAFAQRRLRSTGLDSKLVAVGVWIGPPAPPQVRAELLPEELADPSPAALPWVEQWVQVDKIMHGRGFSARRATGRDLAFLFHRSLSMGVPVPVHAGAGGERWAASDLAEFVDRRVWLSQPYGPTIQIRSEDAGAAVERHVAVLTVGVMPELFWPESGSDPWMLAASRLPFPVEWSLSGTLLKASALASTATFERDRAEGIREHYADHHVTPPPAVERAIGQAVANLDEITEGDARTAARWAGTIRLAVYGNTEAEALGRARELVDHYGERLRIPLGKTIDQPGALREFIPGEPRERTGWQRRLPVKYLAAGLPNVDSELGTPTGFYLGYGIGACRRAARCDLHYGPEVLNTPGLITVTAEPGGGKSVLVGDLAYNAVRAGERTIIFDPSGPLARLCTLPELAPHSQALDLTLAVPGTLAPYRLIPEPTTVMHLDERGRFAEVEYHRAKRRARAERQQLMFDVLRMWLPTTLLRTAGVDVWLRDAVRATTERAQQERVTDVDTNPRWALDWLTDTAQRPDLPQDQRSLVRQIAAEIGTAAEFPLGELVMPPHSEWNRLPEVDLATLVVVTMPGLNPPPERVEREFWSSEERYAQPLLHLAAFFASRFIYSRPRSERKNVFLDENHLMGQWGSGRAFFIRLSRDSRKWNTAIVAASQHPDDHLSIGQVKALTGGAFVGRLTDADTATAACTLLQVPAEYAPVIQTLSSDHQPGDNADGDDQGTNAAGQTGEFIWRDPLGRVGKLRIDMDWHPSLRAALVTTPGRRRPVGQLTPEPVPFIDPALFDTIPDLGTPPVARGSDDSDGAAA